MPLRSYYFTTIEIVQLGYREITTAAELLVFINKYGGALDIPGTVSSVTVYSEGDSTDYLLADMTDGEKVFYLFDIGQKVKKRIRLGDDYRQTTKSTR